MLTEEEALPLLKGRENDIQLADKKVKKAAKLSVSDAVDNATLYGDIRVRYEDRTNDAGTGFGAANVGTKTPANISETKLGRARYKMTLGVKTESGDWYSDLAFVMGAKGRSDNADFGANTSNEIDSKQAIQLKRAAVGYKATDWLTVEAGRKGNPLYTSSMVWDADLNVEGLAEKVNYKLNYADLFFTAVQSEYLGVRKLVNNLPQVGAVAGSYGTSELFAFQGGAHYLFNDVTAAKSAVTYTTYSKNPYSTYFGANVAANTANSSAGNLWGVNDLDIIEIPAEVNYMATSSIGVRLFEHFAINTSADDRAKHSGIVAAANGSSGNDDIAWTLGLAVGSANDFKSFEANKMVKGDWNAKLWYQSVGIWSVDAALVDSDIFDGRVNIEGTSFKAQYNVQDNVAVNFTAAHGNKKNTSYYAMGIGDLTGDITKLNLIQLDLTYKF